MSEMRRVAVMTALLAIAAGAVAQAKAVDSGAAPAVGRAVVMVSTPDLPSGRSAAARARWHELRSDSAGILDRVARRNALRVESSNAEIGALSVDVGPGGLAALRSSLADDPRVQAVRPDVPVQLRYSPNDYAFTHQDANAPNGDLGQWNLIREGGPGAWDLSKGTGAEVAVVDTGADGSHPDLAPRIVGSASFGTSSSPLTDSKGHGTHTAGLACGDADNGYGIASIGFHCGLFIAKIGGLCSDVANGITAAADRNSDVISMSLGGCPPDPITSALSYAQSRGSVLVAAADNDPNPDGSCGGLFDPHNCLYPEEWVQPLGTGPTPGSDRGLVVTAAKYDGTVTTFAETTSRVSVAAFGAASDTASIGQQGILSTWPANSVTDDSTGGRTTVNGDSRFAYLVGTSMATPQVAGVAALIRSVKPNMPNTQVVQLIKATASHCGSYRDGIGWGVIRADQAVAAALNADINPPTSRIVRAKRARHRAVILKIQSDDPRASGGCVNAPAAGVKEVLVFASVNGRPYHQIGKTSDDKLRLHAKRHRRYRFYSVAIDKAGNREAAPTTADAKLKRRR
jgi:Subtilisin-like serine proteases